MHIKNFVNNNPHIISNIQLFICYCMFVGFNYSRALLSIAIVVLFAISLGLFIFQKKTISFFKDKFNLACCLYFGSILMSGIWSENTQSWMESVANAMPFIALPFSFTFLPFYNLHFIKKLILGIIFIMVSGIIYTLVNYILNIERFGWWLHHFESVPSMPHDYIRHTIGVAVMVMLAVYGIWQHKQFNWLSWQKILLWIGVVLGTVLIHLQIAKTGLIAFYGSLIVLLLYYFFKAKHKAFKFGFITAVGIGCIIVANTGIFKNGIATFKKEIALLDDVTEEEYLTTSSYLPRIVSFNIAIEAIKKHPLTGVGIGDVKDEMIKGYEKDLSDLPTAYRLIPHNQYLYNAMGLGIPMGLITIWMLLVGIKNRYLEPIENIYAAAIAFIFVLLCAIEAVLVVQMSIFIYLFFALFFRNITIEKLKQSSKYIT
jgi:O-antigen ligase